MEVFKLFVKQLSREIFLENAYIFEDITDDDEKCCENLHMFKSICSVTWDVNIGKLVNH